MGSLIACEGEIRSGGSAPGVVATTEHTLALTIDCPEEASGQLVVIQKVRSEDDREVMVVNPNPELGGEASVMWRGELNGDGQEDIILRFYELCGNWGECPWAIYAGCGKNRYVTVWPATYTSSINNPEKAISHRWSDLSQIQRNTDAKDNYASMRTLRFNNGIYRIVTDSEKRLP